MRGDSNFAIVRLAKDLVFNMIQTTLAKTLHRCLLAGTIRLILTQQQYELQISYHNTQELFPLTRRPKQ